MQALGTSTPIWIKQTGVIGRSGDSAAAASPPPPNSLLGKRGIDQLSSTKPPPTDSLSIPVVSSATAEQRAVLVTPPNLDLDSPLHYKQTVDNKSRMERIATLLLDNFDTLINKSEYKNIDEIKQGSNNIRVCTDTIKVCLQQMKQGTFARSDKIKCPTRNHEFTQAALKPYITGLLQTYKLLSEPS